MFDRHQAEITVMQFPGHSLPVHWSMSVPWDFTLSHIVSQVRLRISSHYCHRNVSLPSCVSLWNGMFGRVEGQYTTLTVSSTVQDISIISIHERWYYGREHEIEYHDPSNGWIFVLASARKMSTTTAIKDVGILLSPCAIKSQRSIEKTKKSKNDVSYI